MRVSRLRDKIEQEVATTLDFQDSNTRDSAPDATNGPATKKRKSASTKTTDKTPKKQKVTAAKSNPPNTKSDAKLEPGLDGTQDVLSTQRQTRGKILSFKYDTDSDNSGVGEDLEIDSDEDYGAIPQKAKVQAGANLPISPESHVKTARARRVKEQVAPDSNGMPPVTAVIPQNDHVVRRLDFSPRKKAAISAPPQTLQPVNKRSSLHPADQPIPSIEVSPPPSPQFQVQAKIPLSPSYDSSDFESDVEINALEPGTILSFAAKHSELAVESSYQSPQMSTASQDRDAANAQVERKEHRWEDAGPEDAAISAPSGTLSDTLKTFELFTDKRCSQA